MVPSSSTKWSGEGLFGFSHVFSHYLVQFFSEEERDCEFSDAWDMFEASTSKRQKHTCLLAAKLDSTVLAENLVASIEAHTMNAVAREIFLSIDLVSFVSVLQGFKVPQSYDFVT